MNISIKYRLSISYLHYNYNYNYNYNSTSSIIIVLNHYFLTWLQINSILYMCSCHSKKNYRRFSDIHVHLKAKLQRIFMVKYNFFRFSRWWKNCHACISFFSIVFVKCTFDDEFIFGSIVTFLTKRRCKSFCHFILHLPHSVRFNCQSTIFYMLVVLYMCMCYNDYTWHIYWLYFLDSSILASTSGCRM